MAAYAALASLSHTINHILSHDHFSLPLREVISRSVNQRVILLLSLLQDFPEIVNGNSLEGRIRDAANQAEDVIEYLMRVEFSLPLPEVLSYDFIEYLMMGEFSLPLPEVLSYDFIEYLMMGEFSSSSDITELEEVAIKIESISEEVIANTKTSKIKDVLSASPSSSSRIPPSHEKEAMVGLDDNLMAIKERLYGGASKLQVIPIVGMGGIGKTTLARNAYHDRLFKERFDVRAWVTVSQDYIPQRFYSDLLNSMKECTDTGIYDGDSDQVKVYKILKGRRYLIVVDDMWSTEAWDDVRMIFPDDNNGSRIMLTTRLSDVAAYVDSSRRFHEMHLMDAKQSWALLHNKVFTHQEGCPPELEPVGRAIAESCRGLPLAIVVIAGLLSTVSRTQASWEQIAENVRSAINTTQDGPIAILSLSYNHLPHHLRPCFLYMAAFPEDYEIRACQLIKLWVAEGFLKPPSGSGSLEEAAEDYLQDLVNRSLVFAAKRKSNGKIKTCSIHDLVRDLCIRIAKEENFIHLINRQVGNVLPESLQNQRRLGFNHSDLDCVEDVHGSSIRTMLCFKHKASSLLPCLNFKLLRLMHTVDAPILHLPLAFFQLFFLRYLAFSDRSSRFTEFILTLSNFSAISNLPNLQTLIIDTVQRARKYPGHKVRLPVGIWRMTQLRHLVCFLLDQLPDPEGDSFPLENLQTLSRVTNFVCTEQILEMIPNLKKLGVCYCKDGYNLDYQLNNLVRLGELEKLKIVVHGGFPYRGTLNPVFPLMLKKLTLTGLQLPWEYMTVIGSLPNLEVLKLRNFACKGDRWITREGEYCQLKYLLIDQSNLEYWITESTHFPVLESLLLHWCWSLREIPGGIGEISTLAMIEVDEWDPSLVKSAKRILEEQRDYGNDTLQVRVKYIDFVEMIRGVYL